MKKIVFATTAVLLLTATSMLAHHGYAEYDRNAPVTLEGIVKHVEWGNPHVILTLETPDRGEYSVEWSAVFQLFRQGIKTVPVKEGDRLIISGSINRNPEKHIITLLREISRPADGWSWVKPQ